MNSIKAVYKERVFLVHGWRHEKKKKDEKTFVTGVYEDTGLPSNIMRTQIKGLRTSEIDRVTFENGLGKRRATAKTGQADEVGAFSLNIPETESEVGSCVFRLYYGDRFIIVKGKYLAFSLKLIRDALASFITYRHKETDHKGHQNLKFFTWVRRCLDRNCPKSFRVVMVKQSPDPYELLCAEQEELLACISNKKCCNRNLTAYIPLYNEKKGAYGWIDPVDVEKFKEKYKDTVKF